MHRNEPYRDCRKLRNFPPFRLYDHYNHDSYNHVDRICEVLNVPSLVRYPGDQYLSDIQINNGYYDNYPTSDSYVNKCNRRYNNWYGLVRFYK